jgi:collagen type III alpha
MAKPLDLWTTNDWCGAEVVGESNYGDAIRAALPRGAVDGSEVFTVASLVPEPRNKHDRNAVAVHLGGRTVGYLPREEAARYAPVLGNLVAQGWQPQVRARVWGAERSEWGLDRRGREVEVKRFVGSVSLSLAEPHLLTPVNAFPPGPAEMLPPGPAVHVTGEEAHMDSLRHLASAQGACMVHATLDVVEGDTGRTRKEYVRVSIDGQPVGLLTPKMSGEFAPTIAMLRQRGLATACRAMVKGNALKMEVILYAAKATELPAEWLERMSGAPASSGSAPAPGRVTVIEPVPPKPTTVRFNLPPGWPTPPAGWEPWSGWAPDPEWPPAPPGWHYWVGAV